MSAFSDYLENQLVNATLRQITFSPPAQIWLGLHVTAPQDNDSGDELIGGGYMRQRVMFTAPINGGTSNTAALVFGPASTSWGTVAYFGLYDAAAGGNLLYWGYLGTATPVVAGDVVALPVGTVTIDLK